MSQKSNMPSSTISKFFAARELLGAYPFVSQDAWAIPPPRRTEIPDEIAGVTMKLYFPLLTICVCLCSSQANSQDHTKPMDSFRSELWQREFRQEEKRRDESKPQLENGDVSDAKASGRLGKAIQEEGGRRRMTLPGQAELDTLREETPIAEWKVDDAADSKNLANGQFHGEATAWELSRSRSDSDAPGQMQMSEGPTMTTYMVGLMACIVVCGALLTGRE